ncbi:transcriptional regulator with GAF, ATPase, and Fis domain [Saccharopolyspora lacisalsi]|uniref:Transcriptional regulator with GAF, ATPase, and Fis domain n=1 Tax=Halosaccharopolyspora lacisalsi TaxID=1000566 RepID=A0A839DYT0_9PSEU|nr:GAF and ANTAR domain-containing protein [Halosaccharopolyspora lacisalsi]MBA8826644.1 transcriptional regulator with GAF, ATPase, and Fis domain [Halosaccharopolyspora lacisalsi]
MTDDDDVLAAFAEIARDLAMQPTEQAVLTRVVTLSVRYFDSCDFAGIMLLHRQQEMDTVAASDQRVRESDRHQARLGEGPCFDAALDSAPWRNRVYRSDDIVTETRWPSYMPWARELGFGCMMGFQLYRDEELFGALDMYSLRSRAFDDDTERKGWVLASHAAVALISARTGQQPHAALEPRQEIGQAIGMLIERYGLSEQEAFAMLRYASQDNNIKPQTAAASFVRTGVLPGESPEPR